jgi:hypothetical protein
MSGNRLNELLSQAVTSTSIQVVGIYTNPRTFGVYKLNGSSAIGRKYRFGNHPVRETELTREYGFAKVVALFMEREQARELASLLNNELDP